MPGAPLYGTRCRLPSGSRLVIVRLMALTALLLGACIVLALLLEASEPSPSVSTPGIKPLPRELFSP